MNTYVLYWLLQKRKKHGGGSHPAAKIFRKNKKGKGEKTMTNSKATKKALFTSLLSLLLCFTMLMGTTFAWFTDSVKSMNNIIKSGNLDIDVQYTLDGENWNNLENATNLFQKGLWEPGHTEVVALKITNNGSLALKYTANMNIVDETVGKTKDGADIVLSDILTVSTLAQQAVDADKDQQKQEQPTEIRSSCFSCQNRRKKHRKRLCFLII